MSKNGFTDRKLVLLYKLINENYKKFKEKYPQGNFQNFCDNIYLHVKYAINNPAGKLFCGNSSQIDFAEQDKAHEAAAVICESLRHNFEYDPSSRFYHRRARRDQNFTRESYVRLYQIYPVYYTDLGFSPFNWYLLGRMSANSSYGFGSAGVSNHNVHKHNSEQNKRNVGAEVFAFLFAVSALAIGALAFAYIISQTIDSFERFRYNENWFRGLVTMASISAGAIAVATLTTMFLANPLASLAVAAGLASPVGFAIFGVVSLALVGGALFGIIANAIQDKAIKQASQNAIDPTDPERFGLSQAEEANLHYKNLNPVAVKCAIVALRAEMQVDKVPGRIKRAFWSDAKVQKNLSLIRQLKKGEYPESTIEVAGKRFDLAQIINFYATNDMGSEAQPQQFDTSLPSAPPLDEEIAIDNEIGLQSLYPQVAYPQSIVPSAPPMDI